MNLDIGCSIKKLDGYVGMDILDRPGVDIVHDIESFPWPIESESCDHINASHVFEHLKPWLLMAVFNECWRVLKPGKTMTIRTPYGLAFALDPTHTIPFHESSFRYLDPSSDLHEVYNPKPWEIVYSKRDEPIMELGTILKKKEMSYE